MATLDDKLLGEKLHYYCSSSEDEEEDSEGAATPSMTAPVARTPTWDGSSVNTGPKGVLKDYQAFQRMEQERQKARDAATLEMVKKMSLTCKSLREEEKEAEVPDSAENDPFFRQYLQQRMQEMYKKAKQSPKFGKLEKLVSGDEFLKAVDGGDMTVIVHVWADGAEGCAAMDGCLSLLAPRYPQIRFCSLEASIAGMSQRFETRGVPALLAYRNGNLVGNFVRLTNNLGEDFFADDLETFLLEHGLLPDKSLVPALINPDDDSGED